MLRHAGRVGARPLVRLAVSARTPADLPYADELRSAGATIALTRADAADRPAGRLTRAELARLLDGVATVYVCGSASFAEAQSQAAAELGVPMRDIRVERFGPTS
jgi:ferredoxin-NADP reductase